MKAIKNRNNKYSETLKVKKKNFINVNPFNEALRITLWYLLLGGSWILFSDTILNYMVKDLEVAQKIQLIKGWLYVLITGMYIFMLIYLRMKYVQDASDELQNGYNEMAAINEELLDKEEEIYDLAYFDRLTKLYNWAGLSIAFDELIAENENEHYAVLYIDVDNIKHINDTLGHEKGNLLLKYIAERLIKILGEEAIVSRISGDEYVVIMKYDKTEVELHKKVTMINNNIRTTWKIDRYEFFITSSIGVSIFPEHGETLETLIKNSDSAMFKAKELGKNQHYLYNEKISQKTENYIEVISQIRHGITNNEFVLYYQPIINLKTGVIEAVEALIRWEHPKRGFLTPYHFIEVAEESGQINEIGKWVFEEACRQSKLWKEAGTLIKISINLSGKRLFSNNLISDIKEVLEKNEIKHGEVQLEITETAVMENLKKAINILKGIRKLGVKLALDDFGTGYSSLTYLKMFPIDVLKIDQEFTKNISIENKNKDNNIVNAVISLAHSLELDIVAEGVEREEQANYLLSNNCDFVQGYYYDKPMKAKKIEKKYFNN